MNTLIETLAKQAGMVEYPTGLGIKENTIWGDRNIEQFAKLVIQECANMCLINDTGDATYIGQQAAEKYIKQRFGVE